jgi:hypothetical protein
MLCTYPWYFLEKVSTLTSTGWPGHIFLSCVSLKLAVIQISSVWLTISNLAGFHSLAHLHGFAGHDAGGGRIDFCVREVECGLVHLRTRCKNGRLRAAVLAWRIATLHGAFCFDSFSRACTWAS